MLIRFKTLINLSVPGVLSRKLMQQIIIKTRNGVLLVIPLIPTKFTCCLCWRRSRMVQGPRWLIFLNWCRECFTAYIFFLHTLTGRCFPYPPTLSTLSTAYKQAQLTPLWIRMYSHEHRATGKHVLYQTHNKSDQMLWCRQIIHLQTPTRLVKDRALIVYRERWWPPTWTACLLCLLPTPTPHPVNTPKIKQPSTKE